MIGHYLTVTEWRPRFRPALASIKSTLVWVRFPGILPELLDEETLTSMGDALGRTIKVDHMSLTGQRCRFARVCVEVNLDAPLLPSLTILDSAHKIEYEGLHLICFKYGKYGHKADECPSLMSSTFAPNVVVDGVRDPGHTPPQSDSSQSSKSMADPLPCMGHGCWSARIGKRLHSPAAIHRKYHLRSPTVLLCRWMP